MRPTAFQRLRWCARRLHAQMRLQLGEGLLGSAEAWALAREEKVAGSGRLDHLAHDGRLVALRTRGGRTTGALQAQDMYSLRKRDDQRSPCPSEARLVSGGAAGPIFRAPSRSGRLPLRTSRDLRPREDLFLPKQNRESSCLRPCQATAMPGSLPPAEVGAVHPHAMRDDGQATCDGDDGASHAPSLCHLHSPGFEPRPMTALGQQDLRRFVQHRSQHDVAGLGAAAIIVELARLMLPRGSSRHAHRRP
ncbi:hypothetical protein FHT02_003288 [Sphingomonas xinjiangensis]|uniref:Uncharacterized protein n=1 Tax=Sphingomonas xinjiangensis TaxID=643568 RepID=A0A840YRD1_9SPHN|nr:hypothetical protein [Sphingomonas xinjiangensis]